MLVKIYRRSCRNRYLGGKRSYKYYRLFMPIPAEFKSVVESFLYKDLEVNVKVDDNGQLLVIIAQKKPPA